MALSSLLVSLLLPLTVALGAGRILLA